MDQKYLKWTFLFFSFFLLAFVINLFMFNSFMINIGSAKNPCKDPLPEFQNLTMYNDQCFFQPPESAIEAIVEHVVLRAYRFSDFMDHPGWRIPRRKGADLCKTYNAYMPQLKKNHVIEAFLKAIQKEELHGYTRIFVPLGLTIKNASEKTTIITWDSDPTDEIVIDNFAVHGNPSRRWFSSFYTVQTYGLDNSSAYIMVDGGHWISIMGLHRPQQPIFLFCHYIPKGNAGNINLSKSGIFTMVIIALILLGTKP